MAVVVDLLAVAVRESGESPHVHPHLKAERHRL
jgi:hypothetical protein